MHADFNFQGFTEVHPETATLLPGDALTLECHFDTQVGHEAAHALACQPLLDVCSPSGNRGGELGRVLALAGLLPY